MKKFWNWKNSVKNIEGAEPVQERTLFLNGVIAEDSWFDDEVSPQVFKGELESGDGDITVWINSPGGDCIAAARIYNMLKEYPHNVTVKIDGLAASAASVIAMAGDKVMMSPVAMVMIHNPATLAYGDTAEMKKTMDMLSEVKESIINAYEIKTQLSRTKIAHLMDAETWMNANKAVELGFADGIMERGANSDMEVAPAAMLCSKVAVNNSLMDKIAAKCKIQTKPESENTGRTVDALMERLDAIRQFI